MLSSDFSVLYCMAPGQQERLKITFDTSLEILDLKDA